MALRLGEMSWPEVAEVIKKPNAIVLTAAATEEAGYHMPLNFDTVMFTHMIERASEKAMKARPEISIIIAPTIPYGEISHVSEFPGSVGVSDESLIAFISDILRCFVTQGFRNIVVFLGHFQNVAAVEIACRKIDNEFKDKIKNLGIFAVNPMKGMGFPSAEECKAGVMGLGHAAEAPTSMMLAIAPENVHMERAVSGKPYIPILKEYVGETAIRNDSIFYKTRIKEHDETGLGTNPTFASKELGEKTLERLTDNIADVLVQIVHSEKNNGKRGRYES